MDVLFEKSLRNNCRHKINEKKEIITLNLITQCNIQISWWIKAGCAEITAASEPRPRYVARLIIVPSPRASSSAYCCVMRRGLNRFIFSPTTKGLWCCGDVGLFRFSSFPGRLIHCRQVYCFVLANSFMECKRSAALRK